MLNTISVCIAVRNQGPLLVNTLASIFSQQLPPAYALEVIVTDDGSNDNTKEVVHQYPATYLFLENDEYHNGVFAKNSSLQAAHGDIVIQQSADVVHKHPNSIQIMAEALQPRKIAIATVYNHHNATGVTDPFQYTGSKNRRPFFFLGACYREDVCAVGGYDPDFGHVVYYDDNWHADCLINTRGIQPIYLDEVIGHHQHHNRPKYETGPATTIYKTKCRAALRNRSLYISSSGPWPYRQGVSVNEILDGGY